MAELKTKENWEHIEYVSKKSEARRILKLLSDNNELYFNDFKDIDYHNTVLEKLVEFGLIETDKSIAYGHTKKYIREESAYRLTNYGNNFFPLINQLAVLKEQTIVAQLASGEFARFKDELSKYFSTIREYLFNTTGLQLVQVKNSYKIQFEDDGDVQITKHDTPITYEIYFLILASLFTKKIDEKVIQKDLADEIIPLVSNTDEEIDKIFNQVISYLVKEKYLALAEMNY